MNEIMIIKNTLLYLLYKLNFLVYAITHNLSAI